MVGLPVRPLQEPAMKLTYREEINAFILDCETLLSPILLEPPLSVEERTIIQFYIRQLASRYGDNDAAD